MKVYLCGGINGLSDADCRDWREVAKAGLAFETLDPMRRDYRGREDQNVNEIVIGDLDDIAQSETVLVNATRPSWGTAMEIVYAKQQQKQIVAWVGHGARVSPWLRYHCDEIHESLDAAIASINSERDQRGHYKVPVTRRRVQDCGPDSDTWEDRGYPPPRCAHEWGINGCKKCGQPAMPRG